MTHVQVDSSDPAAAFTSGPYGHGSRVFAKVPCCSPHVPHHAIEFTFQFSDKQTAVDLLGAQHLTSTTVRLYQWHGFSKLNA